MQTAPVREHGVAKLMVVPNRVGSDGSTMLTNAGEDFSRVLAERGYRLVASELTQERHPPGDRFEVV
jgi:hypothetical protein